jgi:hypothetical protein
MDWKEILVLVLLGMFLALSLFGMLLGLFAIVNSSRKRNPYLQWYIHLVLVILLPPLEFFFAIKEFGTKDDDNGYERQSLSLPSMPVQQQQKGIEESKIKQIVETCLRKGKVSVSEWVDVQDLLWYSPKEMRFSKELVQMIDRFYALYSKDHAIISLERPVNESVNEYLVRLANGFLERGTFTSEEFVTLQNTFYRFNDEITEDTINVLRKFKRIVPNATESYFDESREGFII